MAGTTLACPHCRAILKSSKTLPIGKRVTCVKCKAPFAVAPEMFATSTSDTFNETIHALAETQAGTMPSPIVGVTLPLSIAKEPVPAATKKTPKPPKAEEHEEPTSVPTPTPLVERRSARNTRATGSWRGVVVAGMVLVLLFIGGAGLAIFLLVQDPVADKKLTGDNTKTITPPAVVVTPTVGVKPVISTPAPKKKKDANQDQVARATALGVGYLKRKMNPTGTWKLDTGIHSVGHAALPALAMLECGVPTDEPVVQQAAAFVRIHAPKLKETYDIGTTILFLDRLGDPADKKLIQNLALRLIAGQTPAGGWSYECPILNEDENPQLLSFLRAHEADVKFLIPLNGAYSRPRSVPSPAPETPKLETPRTATEPAKKTTPVKDALTLRLRALPIVSQQQKKIGYQAGGPDDNSNTHFGLLGLWAARRHGMPVDRSLGLAAERFQKTQAGDGGWGYVIASPPKNTMTCVGLLGLAMGHGAAAEIFAEAAAKDETASKTRAKDPAIQDGLIALGLYLDGHDSLRGLEARIDLYYLWTLERVGMLYGQEKFGKKDWYAYGTKLILERQDQDGRWQIHYDSHIDTAFALLFLQRSDLVPELSSGIHSYLAIPNATLRARMPVSEPLRPRP